MTNPNKSKNLTTINWGGMETKKKKYFFFDIKKKHKPSTQNTPKLQYMENLKFLYWFCAVQSMRLNDVNLWDRIRPKWMLEFSLTFPWGRYEAIAIQCLMIRKRFGFRSFLER